MLYEQDARLDGLRRMLDQHHHDFTDACAMLDTKIRDAANTSAAQVERVHEVGIERLRPAYIFDKGKWLGEWIPKN